MKPLSIYLFLISFLFPAICLSQDATIKGKITDARTQETLIGVNVVLEDNTGTASDIDGNYELNMPEGKHTILYRYIGYTSQTKTIEVRSGEILTIDIVMEEKATELGTVVVSAGKFEQRIEDVTVSMEVIMPSMVENKATTNISTVLDQTPGVMIIDTEPQIRSGSGYSFGAGSRVMIMIDDLPILSGDAGRPSWSFFPVENLEQIEIIKGASSVLYGSTALSGVINIRTAYPKDKPETKINVHSGIYDKPQNKAAVDFWGETNPIFTGMNFFHSRKIKNFDLVIGGNIFLDNGYVGPAPENADSNISSIAGVKYHVPESTGSFENRIRLNANMRYRSKKIEGLNYGVNFNGMYAQFTSELLLLDTDTGMYRAYPGGITRTLKTMGNIDPFINYYDKKGNRQSLRTRIYFVDNNNDNDQANRSTVYYGEYQYQKHFRKIEDFTMTSGITSTYSTSNSELYARIIDDNDSTTVDTTSTDANTASNMAAYLQLDKKFLDRITVSAGMRWERFQINNDSAESKPVFRAGVSARILKATYIRSSFGQGFRFPTIAEKYVRLTVGPMQVYPNLDIQSERSWNAEVGIKQGIKLGKFYGYLDIAFFQQEITNSIEFNFGQFGKFSDPLFGLGFKSVNVGKARIRGIDMSIVGQGKLGPVTLNILAGYTYTNPVALTPDDTILIKTDNNKDFPLTYKNTSSDTIGNLLKYRFEHLAKADIELSYSKFSLGVSFRYNSFMKNVDKVFEDLDELGILPTGIKQYREDKNQEGDYIFDMRASFQMSETSKIAVIINNMFNREYMTRPLQIRPPRTYALQYTLTF